MSLSGLWEMFEKKSSYLYLGSTFLINLKDNQWVDNSLWLAFRMFLVLKHVLKNHTHRKCVSFWAAIMLVCKRSVGSKNTVESHDKESKQSTVLIIPH